MPGLITERNFPTSWTIKRFKYCAQICNGGEYSDIEVEEDGYPVIGSGGEFARASKFSYCGKSVLLGRKGTVDKPLFVDGAFWCVDTMFYTKIKDFMYEKYLYYCALCFPFDYYVTSTALPSMTQRDLGSQEIAMPPKKEQKAIADFLDKECAQIDSIAADLEKQIALLQQYKKSLITETVIKGLNKSVPMKDSGTDWIPYEIPEQWELSKIKYIFNLRDEKNYRPLEEVNLISLYTDLGVVQHCDLETTTGNKAYTADGYKKVYVDDIVVNIILCWMGAIGISQYEGVTSPAYDVYYAIDKEVICPQYYHYLFKIEQFHGKCYSVGRGIMAMRWRTYSSEFRNITVPVPSMQEQREIAEFLDKKCSIIDQIILHKEKQLKSIQQHKKSLIYEYVTGKKRVKEVR